MQNSESILEYFFKGTNIKIPVYQRNYDWNRDNCEQLFRDVVRNVRYLDSDKKHFFGSIIYIIDQDSEQRCIIDGQQRLVTTALLLAAMRDLLRTGDITSEDTNLASRIDGMLVDQYSRKVFIVPIKKDQNAYNAIILYKPDDYVVGSNLQTNYELFKRLLVNLNKDITVDKFYRSISRLQVMIIRLNSQEDDAQMVFESINSTGLSLTEGDKIRNFLLMNLEPKVQDRLYNDYWVKIEDNAGDVSTFFRDYLTAMEGKTPNLNRVYQAFKDCAECQADVDGIERIFRKLLSYSRIHKAIRNHDLNMISSKASKIMYRINYMEYTVSYPFIMRVLNAQESGRISKEDTETILDVLDNYLFRRAVCKIPTNALNKVFPTLYISLDKLDISVDAPDKLRYILLAKNGSSRYPCDSEVVSNLSIMDIYRNKNLCACVLSMLESRNKDSGDVLSHIGSRDPCDRLTIEHVMPQNITNEWKNEIGKRYEEVHETWLHRLGNLTLTAYNSEFGCKSYSEKKNLLPGGLAHSPLNLNQCFKNINVWNEKAIEERNKMLVKDFIGIVTEFKTHYKPKPGDNGDIIELTLDEDEESFIGFKIRGYSFKGIKHECRSGIEAFVGLMNELYECNPQRMLAAEKDKTPGTIGNWLHYGDLTDQKNYEPITKDLYAYRGMSNQTKVNILRKAALLQDVMLTDLAFLGQAYRLAL